MKMPSELKYTDNMPATRREFIASAGALLACAVTAGCGTDKPQAGESRPAVKQPSDQEAAPTAVKSRTTAATPDKLAGRSSPAGKFVWKTIASGKEGPGARSRHELAYDANNKSLLLFGGVDWSAFRGQLLGDTWMYRDGKWSQVHTEASPSARHRGAMVYDPVRGCQVLFGGQGKLYGSGYSLLADTWTFADGQWKKLDLPAGSRPSPRCGHSMVFDEKAGFTVLFGGISPKDASLADTWTFDGSTWTQVSGDGPTPRRYAAFAYDPDLEGCVLQGGSLDDVSMQSYGETWLFRDNCWQYLGTTMDATPCDDQELAYHRAAERLVMCGGQRLPQALFLRSPGGWRRTAAEAMPPRHQCSTMVWSDALNGLVRHGGETGQEGRQFDATLLLEFVKG
jgi:hypothetical protein